VIPIAGVSFGWIGSGSFESAGSLSSELTGEDPSVGIEVGTSLVVLDTGVSDGLTEDTGVDEGRSDSVCDEITSDGLGVAEGFREALSWP
jgi:hypothetical protein